MNDLFFVPEDKLIQLSATRSGRISYAGYNYQCGYAVARLASMVTKSPLFNLTDHPKYLRYDWGEDLDEVLHDDSVCFTQCKRINDIGQPAKLAEVLLGFAPKWLWTPLTNRDNIQFRLVCCDPRFQRDFNKDKTRINVLKQFKELLNTETSTKSDSNIWNSDAKNEGFEVLFNALWEKLSFVYVDSTIIDTDPAGVLLFSESAARDLLLRHGHITASTQETAIKELRCLINNNLIEFDPMNDTYIPFITEAPVSIDISDVNCTLIYKKENSRSPSFQVVNKVVLSEARTLPKNPNDKFLFEPPDWRYVVHGTDKIIKFIERDQTDDLLKQVRESLIHPLLRGTSNLPVLFVTGPPGAGKSTLMRRVSAMLVESGEIVVADAGLNLANMHTDLQLYAQDLQELANTGRPVLLVMDDPLFEESEWINLLIHLKQPGFRVAAIAATPDMMYHRYHSLLSKLSCNIFTVMPPTYQEKQQFAEMYDRDINVFGKDSNDFFVMVAEAESGEKVSLIMERLWQTLNGGRPFNDNLSFNKLPWEVRAFWFVSFIHRYLTLCPLPILKEALELSGGTGGSVNIETALAKLITQRGWKIFRFTYNSKSNRSYQRDLVSTTHQKISSMAWTHRPMKWFDSEVNKILAQATVEVPQSIRNVAIAAGRMAKDNLVSQSSFARELITHWAKVANESQKLENRYLHELISMLILNGGYDLVGSMRETLHARATGKDGWIVALTLHNMSTDDAQSRSFPESINLASLIENADFSVAPRRSIDFIKIIGKQKELLRVVYQQLFKCLEGLLDWELDSSLLVWLLIHAPKKDNAKRFKYIITWLKHHDNDTFVRTQYLSFLQSLPTEFDDIRKQAVEDINKWLVDPRHYDDSVVRTQYLSFLQGLPTEFDDIRMQAVADTANWLKHHDDDSYVRTQYLSFLQGLPAEFDDIRKQAVEDISKWLADPRHYNDSNVRTQYLSFLENSPLILDDEFIEAAKSTSEWLEQNPNSQDVLGRYLSFLLNVPITALEPYRLASIKHHQQLIKLDPISVGHNFVFAEQLLRLSQFDKALTQYNIVLKRHKDHTLARRGRAIALQKLGRMQEAKKEFKHALWWAQAYKQPKAKHYTSLGEFYLESQRWLYAINSFQEAQKEFPHHYINHWGIARSQIGLGNFEQAKISLQLALKDPNLKPPAKDEILQLLDEVQLKLTKQ